MASLLLAMMLPAGMARAGESEVERLRKGLQSPKDAIRAEAVRKLKVTGAEATKAADLLIPLLADKNPPVQQAAAAALWNLGKDGVLPLGQALQAKDLKVRRDSLAILQKLGPRAKEAAPAVARVLGGPDIPMRNQAATMLRTFGPEAIPAIAAALKNDPPEVQLLAVGIMDSFGKHGKAAIGFFAERARSDHAPLRMAALASLIKQVPEAFPSLGMLLADKSPPVRLATALALKEMGPAAKEAKEALAAATKDSDEQVRTAAAGALRKIGPPAIPVLCQLLHDKQTRVLAIQALENMVGDRTSAVLPLAVAARAGEPLAVRALGKMGPSAAPVLLELLADQHAAVRVAALETLSQGGIPGKALLPHLNKLAKDLEPDVRSAAVRLMLKSLPSGPEAKNHLTPVLLALADKDWQTRRSAALALAKVGPAAVAGLIEVVETSPDVAARAEAILALGTMGQSAKSAIKPLLEVLRDPNHRHLHTQALAALANMNPEAGAALVGLLNDQDSAVRVTALSTLTMEQARAAKVTLLKMLSDPAADVRAASAAALTRAGAGLVAEVEPLLLDPKAEVRAAALQAMGPHATLATLSKFLRDEASQVNQTSAMFLAQRGSEAFPALAEALRSKNFRAERAAANAITLMSERADDLIPVLVEAVLAKETQEPDTVARTILRVNPTYGARQLAHKASVPEMTQLMKKAGFLEKEHPEVQELVCLALAERGPAAAAVLPTLADLLKNPKTGVNVLAAATRAVLALGPKDAGDPLTPELLTRIVRGTQEKSRRLRDEGMNDLLGLGLKGNTFEAILTMLSLDIDTEEANAWLIHHADASNSWNLAGPNLVRVLALFQSRGKLGLPRLTPAAEEALQAHLWRYLHQPLPGKTSGLETRTLPEVAAVLPIDNLSWMISAYLAMDLLKEDPAYKDRKIRDRTLQECHQDWTVWWRDWAKHRAFHGLWSEMGLNSHQTFIWPNLLNMADLASDPIVKQRFRMLLDLTMIEEEQISIQGTRAGRRGKGNEVGSNLDPWKDILFGESPRRFTDANINYRGIYWTSTYQLPAAAILLRKLPRPETHYAVTNHHFHGGTVFAYAAPHYVLGCQFSLPKSSTEFIGAWHRLVFDDLNAVIFPLPQGARHQVQHKNVYIGRWNSGDHPAVEFTSALKAVEKDGWIFLSNGPAFAGIHVVGGYRFDRSGRKDLGRQTCDAIFAKTPTATVLLHAGDAQSFGSFEKFQDALLQAPLKVTEELVHYTGPNAPAIEFFRDPGRPSRVAGTPQSLRSEVKCYDSPYLQGIVGQNHLTVRVGRHQATYDFDKNAVTEVQGRP